MPPGFAASCPNGLNRARSSRSILSTSKKDFSKSCEPWSAGPRERLSDLFGDKRWHRLGTLENPADLSERLAVGGVAVVTRDLHFCRTNSGCNLGESLVCVPPPIALFGKDNGKIVTTGLFAQRQSRKNSPNCQRQPAQAHRHVRGQVCLRRPAGPGYCL
jgi:hypothetical protein